MKYPQFTVDEILTVLRRRRKIFFIPLVIISLICISAAFLLPQKYESSITILVQKDQVLNPLISYTMAVETVSNNRLKDFNEIVYSRPVIEALIDSLGMQGEAETEIQKEKLIKEIKKNIVTELKESNSYTINYFDTIPARAQTAARVLSELFIKIRLKVNNRRNELAVEFFENKLNELRDKFEKSQQQFISTVKQQVSELPIGDHAVYSQIDDINSEIGGLDDKIKNEQSALDILRSLPANLSEKSNIKNLYNVTLLNVPYAGDLLSLLKKYDDLSQKYTSNFPELRNAAEQIPPLVNRMKQALESDLTGMQNKAFSLEKERNNSLATVRNATIQQNENQDVRSTYNVYSRLYDDMKVKLEQAKTTRDLGEKGGQQYVVIDPPQLPTNPAKPNKSLFIGGGFSLGLFVGFLAAGLTELFDTRIRTNRDVEIFDKPVLAYLPASFTNNEN